MLGKFDVRVDLGVKDLDAARDFYEDVLGLEPAVESEWQVTYKSGKSMLNIYKSEFAGTNKATYCTWEVDDVAAAVEDLKGKGVTFEHYDMPGVEMKGDVHTMDDWQAAWFKDPDGNILCVASKA